SEITDASSLVQDVVHPEANIIFGTVIDDTLGDEVRVTVIAAGFDDVPVTSSGESLPERGRRGSHVETLEDLPAVATAATLAPAPLPTASEAEVGQFGGPIANPPVEDQLRDPAFDGDDDDLDIPEFLK